MRKLTKAEYKEIDGAISYYDSLDADAHEKNFLNGLIKLKRLHDKVFANGKESEVKE